jgi:ADP-heptose:LPS heptosyltransferase
LASISAVELAQGIIDDCLRDGTWSNRALDALIERALDETDEFVATAATRALFSIVIERLADLFEPSLVEIYVRLFTRVIARAIPDYNADDLLVRYRRISQARRFQGGELTRVFVLSRITLGADVAVTSVALSAMKKLFPEAEICLVGPAKNAELFAADERILSIPVSYSRSGLLKDRLMAVIELHSIVDEPGTIVIDPDSRLTQLGLIPVCDDSRYYFFESRAFGGSSDLSLPELTSEWLRESFFIENSKPYVAPVLNPKVADVAVSWGVGENAEKRVNDEFESGVLSFLLEKGRTVIVDRGAGGEEAARIDALQRRLNSPFLHIYDGSYAGFASHIVQSSLYVGYDSVGQHVAAAAGVPLVSAFAGYPCERMFSRWRPQSPHAHVIAIDDTNRSEALALTLQAIEAAEAARSVKPTGSS